MLSTCNRVEVYGEVASYHAGFLALKRLLVETRGIAAEELAEPLYAHWEVDAADHLFAVSSGLDSMVLGETQIATPSARGAPTGPGRGRVVAVTDRPVPRRGSSRSPGPPGDVARRRARCVRRPRRRPRRGCGRRARRSRCRGRRRRHDGGARGQAPAPTRRGAGGILNRSLEHARSLAERTSAEHGPLDALPAAPGVPTSRGERHRGGGHGHPALRGRRGDGGRPDHPLVLLDLAVPRDIDPETAYVEGARVIDIVSLRERLAEHDAETTDDIARAHEIVGEEVRRYVVRRRGDELAPLIRAVRRRGDAVVAGELDRFASRLAELTPDERAAVEAIARGIAAKLLHDPIVALKERSEPGTDGVHARVLADLLGVEGVGVDGDAIPRVSPLRIGTRRSPLALAQAEEVARLEVAGVIAEVKAMSTSGDEHADAGPRRRV